MLLVQELAACKGGAGDGVGEGLGLGLRGGGRGQGGLGLGGRASGGEQLDLLADGPAEIAKGLIDVARVVVGFGRVLVADKGETLSANCPRAGSSVFHSRHSQHLLVDLLQGIDALLQVDVIRGQLGLSQESTSAQANIGHKSLMMLTLSSAWPSCSLVYWKVRDANGVICVPKALVGWFLSAAELCAPRPSPAADQ